MAVERRIAGPQARYERSGAQALRDIRPFTTRLSEGLRGAGSAALLAGVAGLTFLEPAVIDLMVPASLLYALWVVTRRPVLPIRLPRSANCPDNASPEPGSRKARMARADIFLGWSVTNDELWVASEDVRQHIAIAGTTGSGKTTAILSLLSNALIQGSGFVFVDGKGDRDLFGKVMGLARRFGREDDVRVLNFMVASGVKDSHRFNPFSVGNPDAIRELLASQLGDRNESDPNGVFRERAVALIGTITPVLVWLRDHKGVVLNIDLIRQSIELPWIWKVAMDRIVPLRDPRTGKETLLRVEDEIPEEITSPLRAYLGELPGYDDSLPLDKQKDSKPREQHGYAQFYFTPIFTQLSVSLGHIFRAEAGDIDMRDIVLNRRILVVNLPSLENSDATLAALGKLGVASLRAMMAQLLGGSLEGTYDEDSKPGMGKAPFWVCFDELASYAASGLEGMLRQGRSLNLAFVLGFQETSGIIARLGEKTGSLLGSANLTIAMRQQDAGKTREWLEKTAGQTFVTQATAYHGSDDGGYREARQAEVRSVARIDWQDLVSLLEGEAIFLTGGRRIYGRVFYAQIDDRGVKRLGRSVMLREPDPEAVRQRIETADALAAAIIRGTLTIGQEEPVSPVLRALVEGWDGAARGNHSGVSCARAALAAVGAVPAQNLAQVVPPPGTPVTSLTPMMEAATASRHAGEASSKPPVPPVDAGLLRRFQQMERAAGVSAMAAREIATSIMAERDEALARLERVDPPAMSDAEFVRRLTELIEHLHGIAAAPARKAA